MCRSSCGWRLPRTTGPTVEGQEGLERLALAPLEMPPGTEQQPPFAPQERPGRAALMGELGSAGFVEGVVDVAQDVEFVVRDVRAGRLL